MADVSDTQIEATIEVFCSYARNDEPLQQMLKTHLSSMQHRGLMLFWHDRQILPGIDWAQEIDEHLNRASLILLLLSADFLASRYCYGVEVKHALRRHAAGEARVIPIVLRAVEWQDEPIAALQALPNNARAITSWSNQDEAFADVAAGIRRVLLELSSKHYTPLLPTTPNAIWNIPFARNPFFTGREEQLTQIREQLNRSRSTAIGQLQAISGLGGIGKTQLAIEYAYRHRQAYQAVLWVSADTLECFAKSCMPTGFTR